MRHGLTRLVAISVDIQMKMEAFHRRSVGDVEVIARERGEKGWFAYKSGCFMAFNKSHTMEIPTTCTLN
jgi:hypothetical protein